MAEMPSYDEWKLLMRDRISEGYPVDSRDFDLVVGHRHERFVQAGAAEMVGKYVRLLTTLEAAQTLLQLSNT